MCQTGTFEARHHPPGFASGFTLIELLVILVIISILISVTLLSVNVLGRDTQIADETRRLEQLIAAVREQAELQGRDFGLRFHTEGYEFFRYDTRREGWYPPLEDPLLRPRELPEGIVPRLYLDGREVVLEPRSSDETDTQETENDPDLEPDPPQIYIYANGDLAAFELTLEREGTDHRATLTGELNGDLRVVTPDEAAS